MDQRFTYQGWSSGHFMTTYYDRRGSAWTYRFNDSWQNLAPDGNLNWIADPTGVYYGFYYDTNRNPTDMTVSDSNNWWSRYFDSKGNMTAAVDPLGHGQSWTYDAFNNVTSHTDAAGNIARFYYDEAHPRYAGTCEFGGIGCMICSGGGSNGQDCEWDGDCPGGTCSANNAVCRFCDGGPNAGNPCPLSDCPGANCIQQGSCLVTELPPRAPTLLTRIVEPGPDGNPPAGQAPGEEETFPVTRLAYYVTSEKLNPQDTYSNWAILGQLKEVIDPNGVWTGFEYDLWGQQALYSEGRYETQTAATLLPYQQSTASNGYGLIVLNSASGGSGGTSTYDANGNLTGSVCGCGNICQIMSANVTAATEPLAFPCNAPTLPRLCVSFGGSPGWPAPVYSPNGELLSLPLKLYPEGCDGQDSPQEQRTFTNTFDGLGRQRYAGIESTEYDSSSSITRSFNHDYDLAAGTYTRKGPDKLDGQPFGVETFVEVDTANRVSSVRRGPEYGTENGPVVFAEYTYNALGLLTNIAYGSGGATSYTYDAAHRLTQIKHRNIAAHVLLQLDYTYTADDLPDEIKEYKENDEGVLTMAADTAFTYDNRRRLTGEVRERFDGGGVSVGKDFDLAYTYDAGGNRLAKVDALTYAPDVLRTEYTYDTSSPATYGSNNNRLVSYVEKRVSGEVEELLSTTWYYYTGGGNVERIVTKPQASATYTATRFGYAFNGRTVTFAIGESWEDASVCPPVNYNIEWAREFRYVGARARYLNRELNAQVLQQTGDLVSISDTWTDYDGDSSYGDFEVTPGYPPTVTNRRSYEPGLAQVDPWLASGGGATDYVTSDHLGTTRGVIQSNNIPTDEAVYTAFGERISGTNHRFGYVGSFGYQAHDEFAFLHVGARYYDPTTGRFLQRDPIGIVGGVNVYAYALNAPTALVDPRGLAPAILESDITQGIGALLCAASYWVPVLAIPGSLLWGGASIWDGAQTINNELNEPGPGIPPRWGGPGMPPGPGFPNYPPDDDCGNCHPGG